ncbi:hypothetical protein H5410_064336 [Solanum commersonii]|uniref:DUF4283 domain-containing protein n=1 Tax=Solanum commersonii TaxID=4109 RepID=A0A9J5VZS7_SOLCO|nr:hypothetical protein H5410_064336 [Solanum commersonii]
MKWARILVAIDSRKIPKEVYIERNRITYHFPIWVECKPRFEIAAESGYGTNGEEIQCFTQGLIQSASCNFVLESHQLRASSQKQHVGCKRKTTGGERFNETCDLQMTCLNSKSDWGLLSRPKSTKPQKRSISQDRAGQLIFNKIDGGNNPTVMREENAIVESEARGPSEKNQVKDEQKHAELLDNNNGGTE